MRNTVRTSELKLKRNWNKTVKTVLKTVSFQPKQNARLWNVSAVLAYRCWNTLFERQTSGGGGMMTYARRRRSQRWIVVRYCNALLFGVTPRVTHYISYILPKVTPSVTSYFLSKLIAHYNRSVCWLKFDWRHHREQFCINSGYKL